MKKQKREVGNKRRKTEVGEKKNRKTNKKERSGDRERSRCLALRTLQFETHVTNYTLVILGQETQCV